MELGVSKKYCCWLGKCFLVRTGVLLVVFEISANMSTAGFWWLSFARLAIFSAALLSI